MGKAWPALDIHVPGCDAQLHELVLAELDDFHPTAIHEPNDTSRLCAFFTSVESRDAAARALAASFGTHLFVESLDVDDENWAARSQAQLRAITIGRLVVAPLWDMGSDPVFTIIVNPSMGFGTGHHATTRLVLRAMQTLALDGRTVLDIGCGSGVLAIAAVKLGARSAMGIDNDPDALQNANENAALNDMGDGVRFELGDFQSMTTSADVVLANLTGGLLERSADTLAAMPAPGGFLIVSGFMDSERASVVSALERHLALQSIAHEEEWMCAVFSVRGAQLRRRGAVSAGRKSELSAPRTAR